MYDKSSLTYNYVYKITNLINNKYYIGVHKTDNLHDEYMGSGKLIKRAIKKYGIENFEKEIIKYFDCYGDALKYEKELVNEELIEKKDCYNIRTGGFGGLLNLEIRNIISKNQKENWKNNKEEIMTNRKNNGHYDKVSRSLTGKKKTEEHTNKINKNPEKILKTAEKHRGMKRSDETKQNQSEAKKKFIEENGTKFLGKGCFYIHNPETGEKKRCWDKNEVPAGWLKGYGKRKHK